MENTTGVPEQPAETPHYSGRLIQNPEHYPEAIEDTRLLIEGLWKQYFYFLGVADLLEAEATLRLWDKEQSPHLTNDTQRKAALTLYALDHATPLFQARVDQHKAKNLVNISLARLERLQGELAVMLAGSTSAPTIFPVGNLYAPGPFTK